MLRSIDKQSGETVESVLEKKRKVATVGRVGLGLTIFSTAGNHLAYAALQTRNSPPKCLMCARTTVIAHPPNTYIPGQQPSPSGKRPPRIFFCPPDYGGMGVIRLGLLLWV